MRCVASKVRWSVALCILFLFSVASEARPPRFELDHITVEDGLSHDTVWEVFQDSRGFLWFGTQNGLDRYDGYEIVPHRNDPDDPHSLAENDVLGIWEDHRGWLWLRTRSGLERFDPASERFSRYRLDPTSSSGVEQVGLLFVDRLGEVWVEVGGALYRYRPAADDFESFSSPADASETSADAATTGPPTASPIGATGAGSARGESGSGAAELLARGRVWQMIDGVGGDLWIGTDHGLYRFDRAEQTFERRSLEDPASRPGAPASAAGVPGSARDAASVTGTEIPNVYALELEAERLLWIGTDRGVFGLDPSTGNLARYGTMLEEGQSEPMGAAWLLVRPEGAGLHVVGEKGILRYDAETDLFQRQGGSTLEGVDFYPVEVDSKAIWIGTHSDGLYRWDLERGEYAHYRSDVGNPRSLSSASIRSLHVDASGILWISGYAGVDKYDPRREQFEVIGTADGLSDRGIWALHEDRAGELFVGTYDQGLDRLDRERNVVAHYGADDGLEGGLTSIVEEPTGELWIGSYAGLSRLSRDRRTMESIALDPEEPGVNVFSLLLDRRGVLWVGTESGLFRRDPADGAVTAFRHDPEQPETSLVSGNIYNLLEDRAGFLWVGSMDRGLCRLDPRTGTVLTFFHDPERPKSPDRPAGNGIATLFEDDDGFLWIGIYGGGLDRLDPERGVFRHFGEADGLGSTAVLGILEDDDGFLWLSTYQGLRLFDRERTSFEPFGPSDGLPSLAFSSGSSFRGREGRMYFGTPSGLVTFLPGDIRGDPHPPRAAVTDLRLFHTSVRPDPDSPAALLGSSILAAPELVFDHRQYIFSFELAALHFASPESNSIAYRLDPFDTDWITTDASNRIAQYSNLEPGDYLFRLKAANLSGVWSPEETRIRVTVLPAPWETWWAKTLYVLFVLLAIGAYAHRQRRKIEEERRINERLRQVDRMKDELLANTSHELRTPLYGMTGLAEALIDGARGELEGPVKRDLSMIASSGQRLARLVDDILDFSKLREQKLELIREPVDLHSLADIVVTLARPLVGKKELELHSTISGDLPSALADASRLQQVLYNLVGNAVKFTEAGEVELSARVVDGELRLEVRDTGIGIAPEHQEKIFHSFEQADASTAREYGGAGLGLAVSRRLIGLHGGRLWVESTPGRGSSFFLSLPISRVKAEVSDTVHAPLRNLAGLDQREGDEGAGRIAPGASAGDGTILVVDDEPVIREVLVHHLHAAGFGTLQAASGADALRCIGNESVDLILLDVMMPRMSGYEVCREIRQSRSREELPILFLSAKNQVEDLVAGLAEGANDYLTKPVGKRELLARLRTHLDLLELHRRQQVEMETLRGLLSICSSCKRIRDEDGAWNPIEIYVQDRSEASFSHGICPTCMETYMSDVDEVTRGR